MLRVQLDEEPSPRNLMDSRRGKATYEVRSRSSSTLTAYYCGKLLAYYYRKLRSLLHNIMCWKESAEQTLTLLASRQPALEFLRTDDG